MRSGVSIPVLLGGAAAGCAMIAVAMTRLDVLVPPPDGGRTAPARMTARVVDGDTLALPDGRRIRLFGIDAVESHQSCTRRGGATWACGEAARTALQALVTGGVSCQTRDRDRYGRDVGLCVNAAGRDVGDAMVRDGWALAYRTYSHMYVEAETAARLAERGIWSGGFVAPGDYRKGAR